VLGDRLTDIADLDDQDRASLLNVIDALITRTRLRAITSGDS